MKTEFETVGSFSFTHAVGIVGRYSGVPAQYIANRPEQARRAISAAERNAAGDDAALAEIRAAAEIVRRKLGPGAIPVSDAEGLFECPVCGDVFPSGTGRMAHVIRAHTDRPRGDRVVRVDVYAYVARHGATLRLGPLTLDVLSPRLEPGGPDGTTVEYDGIFYAETMTPVDDADLDAFADSLELRLRESISR